MSFQSGFIDKSSRLVIESANNSNGTWVRFSDGTQICSHILTGVPSSLFATAVARDFQETAQGGVRVYKVDVTWTYPATFKSQTVPMVTGQGSNFNSSALLKFNPMYTVEVPNHSFANLILGAASNEFGQNSWSVVVPVVAVGRWY